jgi:hypothetical protein
MSAFNSDETFARDLHELRTDLQGLLGPLVGVSSPEGESVRELVQTVQGARGSRQEPLVLWSLGANLRSIDYGGNPLARDAVWWVWSTLVADAIYRGVLVPSTNCQHAQIAGTGIGVASTVWREFIWGELLFERYAFGWKDWKSIGSAARDSDPMESLRSTIRRALFDATPMEHAGAVDYAISMFCGGIPIAAIVTACVSWKRTDRTLDVQLERDLTSRAARTVGRERGAKRND